MMRLGKNESGFGVVELLIAVVVIAVLGFGGWAVWHKNHNDNLANKTNTNSTSQTSKTNNGIQPNQNTTQTDPSEGGKYLVIKEWGVRAELPIAFKGKVTYKISDAQDPDTGLPLEGADIFVLNDTFTANSCATTETSLGSSITTATTYLRSDSSQAFNSDRYKGTLKANILQDGKYSYHLNYVVPDCLGSGSNEQLLKELQDALPHLQKMD